MSGSLRAARSTLRWVRMTEMGLMFARRTSGMGVCWAGVTRTWRVILLLLDNQMSIGIEVCDSHGVPTRDRCLGAY